MTKRDVKYVAAGIATGTTLFLVAWFFMRKKVVIPEVSGNAVRWVIP